MFFAADKTTENNLTYSNKRTYNFFYSRQKKLKKYFKQTYIPAVYDDGGRYVGGGLTYSVEEVEGWPSGSGHAMVWPGCEPVVGNLTRH